MNKIILFVCILISCGTLTAQQPFRGEQCITVKEFIYQPEDVAFPSCHASTIAETDGGLIAAWFGGTAEKNPDVGIWTSRFTGGKWAIPEEPANGIRGDKRYPCWHPVLFNSGDELLLFFKVGSSPSEWWGELIVSCDNGISWSAPRKLPEGFMGPVKNKPVLLDNGVLLCPSSSEHDGWRVHMEMTPDFGMTWTMTEPLNDKSISANQPS
ncbi:MAG TPA: sialidase, partial [Bacteroidales bacterium]|nr:sialidase [Bacteroidales bacterium]